MGKAFAVNFSDLAGATNPDQVWSPEFLAIKKALDTGDPNGVVSCLRTWMARRGMPASKIDAVLKLKPDEALHELARMVHQDVDQLRASRATPAAAAMQTLRQALRLVADQHIKRGEHKLRRQGQRFAAMRRRYTPESATGIVNRLLEAFYEIEGFRGFVSPEGERFECADIHDHGDLAKKLLKQFYPAWTWDGPDSQFMSNGVAMATYALQYRGWVRVVGDGLYSTWQLTGQTRSTLTELITALAQSCGPEHRVKIDFWLNRSIDTTAEEALEQL